MIKKKYSIFLIFFDSQDDEVEAAIWQFILTLKRLKPAFLNQGELDPHKMRKVIKDYNNYVDDKYKDEKKDFSYEGNEIIMAYKDKEGSIIVTTPDNMDAYQNGALTLGQLLGYGSCSELEREDDSVFIKYVLNNNLNIITYGCSKARINKTSINDYKDELNKYFNNTLGIGKITVVYEEKN